MDKIKRIPNLRGKLLAQHVVGLAGILYASYTITKFFGWQIKNYSVKKLARETLKNRNKSFINYDLSKIDVEHVLSLNVDELRQGLFD